MQSKFEVWIPKLGCEVDATKQAWRFDAIGIRSVDFEAWMQGGCNETGMEINWESGAIAYSNEVRCTKFTSTKIRGF